MSDSLYEKKIRVAVVGCGQICDAHLLELGFLSEAEVVAVCDLIPHLAEDTAERFGIRGVYTDHRQLIDEVHPDVVHVTTPPHTHRPIGLDIVSRGCHAYIEKPFGVSFEEAAALIDGAKNNGVMVCAGFSQWYDDAVVRFRRVLAEGLLGDIVHFESYYGDSLEGSFSRLFQRDPDHWIHRLPGKLFHNLISHALYHVVPLFRDPVERIVCFTQSRSNDGLFDDELRVMLQSRSVTGYLTYTSAVKPIRQYVSLYGTRAIVEIDFTNHILKITDTTELPGPFARVRNALVGGKRLISEGFRHLRRMSNGTDRFFAGMGRLFSAFYSSIRQGRNEPPVPYHVVLDVSAILDRIANQCRSQTSQL